MLCSIFRKKYLPEGHDQGIIHQQRHLPFQKPSTASISKPSELLRKQAMAGNKNKTGWSWVEDDGIRRCKLTLSHGSDKYTMIYRINSFEKEQQIGWTEHPQQKTDRTALRRVGEAKSVLPKRLHPKCHDPPSGGISKVQYFSLRSEGFILHTRHPNP